MNNYIERECDKCGVLIMVRDTDESPRYYCHACAMSKMGEMP